MPKRGIVLMGQSNGFAGYAEDRIDAFRTHPNLWQFKQNKTFEQAPIQPLDMQSLGAANRKFVSYTYYLVRDYLIPRNPGVDYCILPQSVGGTGFSLWWHAPNAALTPAVGANTVGVHYETAITQINAFLAAEVGNTIDCVILQNGEQETGDAGLNLGYYHASFGLTDKQAYTRYVTEMVADMAARVTGGRTWPFLIGRVPPDLVYQQSQIGPSACGHEHNGSQYIPIFEAQGEMPTYVTNCGVIDSLSPTKALCHDGIKRDGGDTTTGEDATPGPDGQPDIIMNSGNYWLHTCQAGHHLMAHRAFKQYMRLKGYGTVIAVSVKAGTSGDTTTKPWMEAPDIVAFEVEDPPIIPGNMISGSFDTHQYNTWFQMTNPRSGAMEWCTPFGKDRTEVRFSDLPNPAGYLNKMQLRDKAKYSISGGGVTISALYYRDEASGQGALYNSGSGQGLNSLLITQRHTIYLKLSGVPPQGVPMTITHSDGVFAPITFTFNDKVTRAGGIQVNHLGQRPDDAHKYGYLGSRVPGAPNNGMIQFGAAPYSLTSFQILDSTKTSVFTGSIVQRVSGAATPGEGYDSGIDVADISQGWTVTGITKGTPTTTITCAGGHGLVVGDKVRFMGISGMTQIESPPNAIAGSLWFAAAVTRADATTFDLTLNSSGFTNFNTTPSMNEAVGGISNKVYKCFNTNRAGTYVYGLDFSSWVPTTSGTHYVYIPGYGISDPMQITSNAWAQATGKIHEGLFLLRHGITVTNSAGYTRGVSLKDGTNGAANYRSKLVSLFCSECANYYLPVGSTGATSVGAGLGAYADCGTFTFSQLTCAGTTITATCNAAHGITVGNKFMVQVVGASPAGYNSAGVIATATTTTQFTYGAVGGAAVTPSPATTPGVGRTGFVTNVRHPGHVGHQDAGDNDGPGVDHLPGWKILAAVFRDIPKPSRFTPFTVPLSSTYLDPVLFAGTDALPPLFHEMFWWSEAYRANQMPDGSVWGGHEIGAQKSVTEPFFSSAISSYPEPIDKYRGSDAGGALTGQTVHAYIFARDHLTNFHWAGLAAKLAQIAYDYSLTALGDAYKASAINSYAWADGLITNPVARDSYYKGELNLKNKCAWSEDTYQNAMLEIDGYTAAPKRGLYAKFDAAGALYRLLGSTAGATYGSFIERACCQQGGAASAGVTTPGTGYAVNDIVTLTADANGIPTRLLVTSVDGGGGITGKALVNVGQYTATPTMPMSQASTTGTGSGATFTLTFGNVYALMDDTLGAYDYCVTSGANATAKSYMQGRSPHAMPALCMAPTMGYMGMFWRTGTTTSGSTEPAGVTENIQAHLHYKFINGNTAAKGSEYLKMMQAGANFIQGANLRNKSYVTGLGPRPFKLALHEDSYKYGTTPPYGINVMGHFAWASSLMFNNFSGSVAGCDGPLVYNSDNTTGLYESYATPGTAKMWNPWRGASSYWEWSPENKAIIYASEFTQVLQVAYLAQLLYLHGWDGNV